jgi:hypothetical protein
MIDEAEENKVMTKDEIKNQLKQSLKAKAERRQLAKKYKMYEDKKQLVKLIEDELVNSPSPAKEDRQLSP